MNRISVTDAATLSSREVTPEGFLRANAAVTRVGVFDYDAEELGIKGVNGKVKVMRTRESVFHPETIASVRDAVLTLGHPPEDVSPENWRTLAVGNAIGEPGPVAGDEDLLGSGVIIRDEKAIKALDDGLRELSIGYEFMYRKASGGAGYDYESVGPMHVNHHALLDKGRAGPRVRVFDSSKENEMEIAELEKALDAAVAKAIDSKGKGETDIPAITKAVMATVKDELQPIRDELDKQKRDALEAEVKTAKDELIADTVTTERKRSRVFAEAEAFLPEGDRDKLRDSSVKEILVAAVGDAAEEPTEQSEDFLRGVLAGMIKNRDAAGTAFRNYQSTAAKDARGGKDSPQDVFEKKLGDWKQYVGVSHKE